MIFASKIYLNTGRQVVVKKVRSVPFASPPADARAASHWSWSAVFQSLPFAGRRRAKNLPDAASPTEVGDHSGTELRSASRSVGIHSVGKEVDAMECKYSGSKLAELLDSFLTSEQRVLLSSGREVRHWHDLKNCSSPTLRQLWETQDDKCCPPLWSRPRTGHGPIWRMAQWRELSCCCHRGDGDSDWEVVKAALDNQYADRSRSGGRRGRSSSRGVLGWLRREQYQREEECEQAWHPQVATQQQQQGLGANRAGGKVGAPLPLSEWALQLRDLCAGVSGGGAESTAVRLFYTFVAPSASPSHSHSPSEGTRPPTLDRDRDREREESRPSESAGRLVLVAASFSGEGGRIARVAGLTSSKSSFRMR